MSFFIICENVCNTGDFQVLPYENRIIINYGLET